MIVKATSYDQFAALLLAWSVYTFKHFSCFAISKIESITAGKYYRSVILSSCNTFKLSIFFCINIHVPLNFKRNSELRVCLEFSSPNSPKPQVGINPGFLGHPTPVGNISQIHRNGLTLSGMHTTFKVKPSMTKLSSSLFLLPVKCSPPHPWGQFFRLFFKRKVLRIT
jgi:hypothetical protein